MLILIALNVVRYLLSERVYSSSKTTSWLRDANSAVTRFQAFGRNREVAMNSRALRIGITAVFILGLLFGGCTAREKPLRAPTEPAPSPEITPPPPSTPAPPTPALAPEPVPTPTPSPPRPETPFVKIEKTMLFQEDFQDGNADGWVLDPGWNVKLEDGNCLLSGSGHSWARPSKATWTDYTIQAKFKLIAGSFHFNFRYNLGQFFSRYFLAIQQEGLHLSKQLGEDFFDLVQSPGTYTENVTVNKRLTLTGDVNQPANVVISPPGGGTAIALTVDSCVLRGFKAQNGRDGIYIDTSNNNTLSNNIVISNTRYAV